MNREEKNRLIEKLKKLQALAEKSPFEGERETAKLKMEEITEKTSVSLDVLTESTWRNIRVRGIKWKTLLYVVLFLDLVCYKGLRRGELQVNANDAEWGLVLNLLDYHSSLLLRERKRKLEELRGMVSGYLNKVLPLKEENVRHRKASLDLLGGYDEGESLAKKKHLEGSPIKLLEDRSPRKKRKYKRRKKP